MLAGTYKYVTRTYKYVNNMYKYIINIVIPKLTVNRPDFIQAVDSSVVPSQSIV